MGLFTPRKKPEEIFNFKVCPKCDEKLPIRATRCPMCGLRVGPVRADGKARSPVDWKAYILSAILIGLLIYYVKWAFF